MLNILATIYPISFGICLLSLILWFFFQGNKSLSRKLSASFLGAFFIYLFALAFSPAALAPKLLILFRDLMVLGITTQFFNAFKNNKILFTGMVAALLVIFKVGYFNYMQESYKQSTVWPSEFVQNNQAIGLDEDGELLIEVSENSQITALSGILDKYDLSYEPAFANMASPELTELDDYYVVNIPNKHINKIDQIIEALNQSGFIDAVEDNEVIKVDPITAEKSEKNKKTYGINDPGIENLWAFDKMNQDQLYNLIRNENVKPTKKAVIAILDTGVDSRHEDIKANYKSISQKHDDDPHSHGTHCAGIAASVSNNKKGIASFSPDNGFVHVTSVKVLNKYGMGTQRTIINGILKAADNGASVISMSLGGPSDDRKQRAYFKAVNYANTKGAIVVVAAGNESRNAIDRSPANVEGVITVSAVDQNLDKASFSNEVHDLKMGIAAPGVNIYSTVPGNKYAFYNGTSMACPQVAGLVGILKSINPDLETKEAYDILNATGIDTKAGNKTGQFIQPAAAVQAILKSE
ncbi:MAG: S8 family serine peptidase [Bacteroidota bacterium]